jgi:hypothetical protein
MDPITGAAAKIAVGSAVNALGKLAQPSRVEKLIDRALLKRNRDLPKPNLKERRRLEALLKRPDIWGLIMLNSVQVSDQLIDRVAGCLSLDHDAPTRRAMAKDLAELFVSELPAALDPEDRTVLNSYQNRQNADQLAALRTLVTGSPVRTPDAIAASADLAEYRIQLGEELLRRRPAHIFDLTYTDDDRKGNNIASLPDVARSYRQVAIHAGAGSGKSGALVDLGLRLNVSPDDLVIYVDLKAWRHENVLPDAASSVTVDDMLEASAVPIKGSLVGQLQENQPASSKTFWLVDGVNELPSEVGAVALEILRDHIRGMIRSSLVVTDRSSSKYVGAGWHIVSLDPLTQDEVDKLLPSGGQKSSDGPGRRDLLRTPFFLDVALRDGDWSWSTSVQAIHGLFAKRLGIAEHDIDVLADFALTTYVKGDGLSFTLEGLASVVDVDVVRRLLESRIVQNLQDGTIAFYHQLLHDYLASRSVAHTVETWIPRYFDAISFHASSYEPLLMVLEQLKSEETLSE